MNRRTFTEKLLQVGSGLALNQVATAQPSPVFQYLPAKLLEMEKAILEAIAAEQIPGAVVWLECQGLVYHKAFGNRQLVPKPQPMVLNTIFDMASLTKVMATTMAVMKLVEAGKLKLADLVVKFVPAFTGEGRETITVKHLLTHTSGLRPGISRTPEWSGYTVGLQRACVEPLRTAAGQQFIYSDINFILLGEIVRKVSGVRLDHFLRKQVFDPLGMNDTLFLPGWKMRSRIAPTELEAAGLVHGEVHDPTSRRMAGVTGHAGLFSTAADVAKLARMMLADGKRPKGKPIFSPETVKLMTSVQTAPLADQRGLGWDIQTRYSDVRGDFFTTGGSYGHTGWTGTSLWIDPKNRVFLVLLTNRNHPSEKGSVKDLRIKLANLAGEACGLKSAKPPVTAAVQGSVGPVGAASVLHGADKLAAVVPRLPKQGMGLITNHTGLTKTGQRTLDVLHGLPGANLTKLFSPEHGLAGKAAAGEKVGHAVEDATGLPIISLYGANKRPTPEQLQGLEVLVFDMQDVGARFYTYISTLLECLLACHGSRRKFIVLDRINPLGGQFVGGPLLHGKTSFIACHHLPIVHGMTIGELAKLFVAERKLDVALEVIPLEGWKRSLLLSQTDIPWVNPSPNLRSLDAALLYPGTCLLEPSNVSVGRGSDSPFLTLGAPWIQGDAWADAVQEEKLSGITVAPHHFTPTTSTHANTACQGLRLRVTDPAQAVVSSMHLGLTLLGSLHKLYPAHFQLEKCQTLLLHPPTLAMIRKGN